MPSKNSTKVYLKDSYYHIYNRGVDKRTIFTDHEDYSTFLSFLKTYLSPKETDLIETIIDKKIKWPEKGKLLRILKMNNFNGEISLLAYCLMPNHFHILIKQKTPGSIDKFMNSLCSRYTIYFNKKHNRVGPLYQGVYKAVLVKNPDELIQLSRYIHKQAINPFRAVGEDFLSSLPEYLEEKESAWIKPKEMLSYFSSLNPNQSYKSFLNRKESFEMIKDLIIETE